MIKQLLPHQQKAFYRRFFKASTQEEQMATIAQAKSVLNANKSKSGRQRNPQERRHGHVLTTPPGPSYTREAQPQMDAQMDVEQESVNTQVFEITDASTQTEVYEQSAEDFANELDKFPSVALESYFQMKLANHFVPKAEFDLLQQRNELLEARQSALP
jgi:hypothetical protein